MLLDFCYFDNLEMVDDSMSPCAVLESDHFLGHIVTDVPTLSFAFTWEITAFSSLPHGNGEVLGSCALEAPDLEGKWSLHLYPRGITVEDEGYVSLYLRYSGGSKVEAAFTLRCGTDDEALPFCKTDTNSFSPNHKSWGWNKFVERHTLVGFLQQRAPAHPLYIHCHVQASGTVTTRRVPPNNPPTCDPEVVAALGQALYQDPGTDVVLLVQGHAIPAHRSILVVQSPVFRAMFSHDLTEKNTGQVEILDHTAGLLTFCPSLLPICLCSPRSHYPSLPLPSTHSLTHPLSLALTHSHPHPLTRSLSHATQRDANHRRWPKNRPMSGSPEIPIFPVGQCGWRN